METSWIELDLRVLDGNLEALRAAAGGARRLMLVVKANAYGHGIGPVAGRARLAGVERFAVFHLGEGLELRAFAPEAEILMLGPLAPEAVGAAAAGRVVAVVVDAEHGSALAAAARAGGMRLACHVKVDTGMGRLGFDWRTAAEDVARLRAAGGLEIRGICSHFASAGARPAAFAAVQYRRFSRVIAECRARGLSVGCRHIANSAAFGAGTKWDLDLARVGIALYGYPPVATDRVRTAPFLSWKTRIVQVKRVPRGFPVGYDSTFRTRRATRVATLAVGYADGYPRRLSNRGWVLAGGRRCPVIGRVSMNLVTVDAGRDSPARAGEDAVLIGRQADASLWADELAEWCGTIPYEILTGIRTARRVPLG